MFDFKLLTYLQNSSITKSSTCGKFNIDSWSLFHYIYLFICFLRQNHMCLMWPQIHCIANAWPWVPDPPASALRMLGFEDHVTLLGMCIAEDWIQEFMHAAHTFCQLSYSHSISMFLIFETICYRESYSHCIGKTRKLKHSGEPTCWLSPS